MKIDESLLKNAEEVDFFSALTEEEKAYNRLLVDIATAVKNKRNSLGYNQKEFARYMGVSQSLVSKWEGYSKNFSLKKLLPILERLNLEIKIEPKPLTHQPVQTADSFVECKYSSKPMAALLVGGNYRGAQVFQSI